MFPSPLAFVKVLQTMNVRQKHGIGGAIAIVLAICLLTGLTILLGKSFKPDDLTRVREMSSAGQGLPGGFAQQGVLEVDSISPVRTDATPRGESDLRTVRGLVVGPLGEPLFAKIRAGGRQTLTNSRSGIFTIMCGAPHTTIDVEAVGYVGRAVLAREGDIGKIVLAPKVLSHVTVSLNGATVPGATVSCWRQEWTDSLVSKDNAIDLSCLETITGPDGSAVLPGEGRWVVYATWNGTASRAAVISAQGSHSLDLDSSYRARVVGQDAALDGWIVARLAEGHREIMLRARAGMSERPLPLSSTPIALRTRDGRIQLRAVEESLAGRDRSIRDFELVGAAPFSASIIDASDASPVAFVFFCSQAALRASTKSFPSYSVQGRHVVPEMPGDQMWVISPGYEAVQIVGTERQIRLPRCSGATQIQVVGADGWSGELVIRNGPITLFCGEVRSGMLGPLDASMLPADVETPDRRVLGKTRLREGMWTVDASGLGGIHITNWHELASSWTGMRVGVWMGKRFHSPEVDGEPIRFLTPGLYSVGYAVMEGGKSRRIAMATVSVVGGDTTEVELDKCSIVEGQMVFDPPECRAELVYYPAWIENGIAEMYGMETKGVEGRYRWSIPLVPRLGVAVADRSRNAIVGVLPPQGGLCRLRRVVLRSDLSSGESVIVSWAKDDMVKAGWECSVKPDGYIDVGWLPLDVAKCSVRHGNEGRVVVVDGSDPLWVSFGPERR
jgi:hypothetical protein